MIPYIVVYNIPEIDDNIFQFINNIKQVDNVVKYLINKYIIDYSFRINLNETDVNNFNNFVNKVSGIPYYDKMFFKLYYVFEDNWYEYDVEKYVLNYFSYHKMLNNELIV